MKIAIIKWIDSALHGQDTIDGDDETLKPIEGLSCGIVVKEEDYHTICPMCTMPISQMFADVYHEEGLFEAIKQSLGRLKRDLQRFN